MTMKGQVMSKDIQTIDHILTSAVRIDSSKIPASSLRALQKALRKLTAHDCIVIDRQTLKEHRYIGRAINASTESAESMVLYQDSDENFYVRSLSDFTKKFDFKEYQGENREN